MALGSVLNERRRVMDYRAVRDEKLIERGNWVGLQRAMEASKVRAYEKRYLACLRVC